jgi:dGTP triphosphohydrolase
MHQTEFMGKVRPIVGCLKHRRTTSFKRKLSQESDGIFNPFVRDENAILNSKAFRVMACKTQVTSFTRIDGNLRNRLSHVMEVVACSTRISDILGLNTDLVRSIAYGHDIGHTPLGHQGESWLAKQMGLNFTHEVMGVVIAQFIQRKGRGLNLTFETLEGMLRHSGKNASLFMTQEAWVVRFADKIAYIFADFNDLLRIKMFMPPELVEAVESFGGSQRQRVATIIADLCVESAEEGKVAFEKSETALRFNHLRTLMYGMYPKVTEQNVNSILEPILECLIRMDVGDPFLILSLMTDDEVRHLHHQDMINVKDFSQLGIWEGIPYIPRGVDMCNPALEWGENATICHIP